MSNTNGQETELQRKIRLSLKKHPQKPGVTLRSDGRKHSHSGIFARYKAVAAEVGCTIGAVQHVEMIERCAKYAKEQQDQRLVSMPFEVPQSTDISAMVKDFPGWVIVFGKLSLVINNYLQIARAIGDPMPASWLSNLRDVCETAQLRSEQDAQLKKYWPVGRPPGSADFGNVVEGNK